MNDDPRRLHTPEMVKELKILINEVLDERDGKRGKSYFDSEKFAHRINEPEPPYENMGMTFIKGKVKTVFSTDNPEEVLIRYEDRVTAGNGKKECMWRIKVLYVVRFLDYFFLC